MIHPTKPVLLLLPFFFLACGTGALDGGSNTSGSSDAGPTPTGAPSGGASQDGIASEPLAGMVVGKAFAATAFELTPEPKSSRWMLVVHNAGKPCSGRRLGDDVVIITVRGLGGEGSAPVDPGDGYFQRGFYMTDDAAKPEIDSADQGRVRFDAKPGAVGSSVAGGLWLKGRTSEVNGTFAATVCPAQ